MKRKVFRCTGSAATPGKISGICLRSQLSSELQKLADDGNEIRDFTMVIHVDQMTEDEDPRVATGIDVDIEDMTGKHDIFGTVGSHLINLIEEKTNTMTFSETEMDIFRIQFTTLYDIENNRFNPRKLYMYTIFEINDIFEKESLLYRIIVNSEKDRQYSIVKITQDQAAEKVYNKQYQSSMATITGYIEAMSILTPKMTDQEYVDFANKLIQLYNTHFPYDKTNMPVSAEGMNSFFKSRGFKYIIQIVNEEGYIVDTCKPSELNELFYIIIKIKEEDEIEWRA